MANYFVINNKFRPYSFDELIKPYEIYGQAYKELETAVDTAREKEFSVANLDEKLDSAAYDMYNTASDNLQSVSDELATRGLSAGLRRRIKNTARDYKQTMDALNLAQTQLIAERDRRAKLGPDYVFQQGDVRIGDFLNGASPNQRMENLTDVTKGVAAEFATKAKAITKETWDKVLGPNGENIPGYYDVTTRSGLPEEDLNMVLALANPVTWNRYVKQNKEISEAQKERLADFVSILQTKMDKIGFDKYSENDQRRLWDAMVTGASAGLDTVTHKHEQDRSYNPLGWANYNLTKERWEAEELEAEMPYTHSDENKPTRANRTGLKPGYSIKNGKLQYNSSTDGSGSGTNTNYTTTTPQITIHTKDGTSTFTSWKDAAEDKNVKNKVANLPTVAIEDVTDPAIQRAMLARINIPTANVQDADLPMLISKHLDKLNQLTIQISGNPDEPKKYVWAISDKKTQRLTEKESEEVDDKTL